MSWPARRVQASSEFTHQDVGGWCEREGRDGPSVQYGTFRDSKIQLSDETTGCKAGAEPQEA